MIPKRVEMEDKVDVLLVEDNESDAELTLRAFRKWNVHVGVLHVQDGEEALEFLFSTGRFAHRGLGKGPKVVLLDLNMPKVGGLDVLRVLKADARTQSIPVVLLSSSSEDRDIRAGYHLGANSYVVKPMDYQTTSKLVSEMGNYWLSVNHPPR